MKKLFILSSVLLVAGLGYGVYGSFQGQDLSDIDGYDETDREPRPSDVSIMIGMAAKLRQSVEISERQMNTWLANNIKARQEGQLADHVKLKGVWVRFEETEGGRAEIIIEREVAGRPHTVSMFIRVERKKKEDGTFTNYIHKDGGAFLNILAIGGRFGQVRVPQGFLLFTQESFGSLSDLFETEIGWIKKEIIKEAAGRVIFEDGKMRIDFPIKK
ncbi:hypothetical protein OAF13_02740 [Akkermansiaceae bacterium]|jgi:hypothetical protein|nr:hypothetical protein [Akkermansiaceae bacterium]MDB4730947.1 hypothetical protein [Akkermansiaceae bacterium]MDB4792539.1 hypothetical protein [bacterium]